MAQEDLRVWTVITQANRFLVLGDRFTVLSQPGVNSADPEVRLGIGLIQFKYFLREFKSLLILPRHR